MSEIVKAQMTTTLTDKLPSHRPAKVKYLCITGKRRKKTYIPWDTYLKITKFCYHKQHLESKIIYECLILSY